MTDEPTPDASDQRDDGETHPEQDTGPYTREQVGTDGAKKTMLYSIGLMLFTFVFVGLGSIPMYRWVCNQLDPGGTTYQKQDLDSYENVEVDESRTVKVRFAANVQGDLPWTFGPNVPSVEVHPGERKLVKFHSKNLNSNRAIKGKAVYDINPPEAGQYFKKVECFCFKEQTLKAGQGRDMPLYFWLEPDLPDDIDKITLAYTFFNAESSRSRDKHTQNSRP